MTRGRDAVRPGGIPPRGWLDIGWRIYNRIIETSMSLIAAGVAFYGLLALFPAITALLAIGGLIVEPQQIVDQITSFGGVLPSDALGIVKDQATAVAGSDDTRLSLAAGLSLALALWSASRGMASLVQGLNIVYEEKEKSGFIALNLRVLALTLNLVIGFVVGLLAILGLPVLLSLADWPVTGEWIASALRWLLLVAMAMVGLAIVYRYGPSRTNARWRWITPGAVVACVVWVGASALFTLYVSRFASYNESFGALAGVIILILWLWISAFVLLLGGAINAEMEAQTRRDTTTGPPRPMGERGAYKADNLGPSMDEAED